MRNLNCFSITVMVLLLGCWQLSAQQGIAPDVSHGVLIPLLKNQAVFGHASVQKIDRVNKDSNSYLIQVFDEFLRDVGEAKLVQAKDYEFGGAVYMDTQLLIRFIAPQKAIRYSLFNTDGAAVWDTTLDIPAKIAEPKPTEVHFRQAHLLYTPEAGLLDYVNTPKGPTLIQKRPDGSIRIWSNTHGPDYNRQWLASDQRYIVNVIFHHTHKKINACRTAIEIIAANQPDILTTTLDFGDSVSIYPLHAVIEKDRVRILSQFTRRAHEFSKIKYGFCVHEVDLQGRMLKQYFNEITHSMANDSVVKRFQLFKHAYLYPHKARYLSNGRWLVAAEQLIRTRLQPRLIMNPHITYNKKSVCLFEVDQEGRMHNLHVEPNKDDGVRLPKRYYRKPHEGAQVAQQLGRLDIDYFVCHSDTPDQVAFVFMDFNYHSGKVWLGNMMYKAGKVSVDRFMIRNKSRQTQIGIFPARIGHVILLRYDPLSGELTVDPIKFIR